MTSTRRFALKVAPHTAAVHLRHHVAQAPPAELDGALPFVFLADLRPAFTGAFDRLGAYLIPSAPFRLIPDLSIDTGARGR